MKISTRHFGVIKIDEDKILSFPRGLIGFENVRRFGLLQEQEFAPFAWLQGVDAPELTLVVIPAIAVRPDYHLDLSAADRELLQAAAGDHLAILLIATIKEKFDQSTVNFLAPVVINERTRLGVQAINEQEGYGTRHVLKDELPEPAKEGESHAGADAQEKAVIDARG